MVASLDVRVGPKSKAAAPSIQLKDPGASTIPWFVGFGVWVGESARLRVEEYLNDSYATVLPDAGTGALPTVYGLWQITVGWRAELSDEPEGVPSMEAYGANDGFDLSPLYQDLAFSGGDGIVVSENQVTGTFRCGVNRRFESGLGSSVASGHYAWVAGHLITELDPPIEE